MPIPANSPRSIELAAAHAHHVAIDTPPQPAWVDELSARLNGKWMRGNNKDQATEALAQLARFKSLNDALLSPQGVGALVTLHDLKVIDLHNCQRWANGRDMNAIDLLVEYAPDVEVSALWNGPQSAAPEDLLRPLANAGIKVQGHEHAFFPPLAVAIEREDAEQWVTALLDLGADPWQPSSSAHEMLGERIGKPSFSCYHMAAQRGLSEEIQNRMLKGALQPESWEGDFLQTQPLFKRVIEQDQVGLLQFLIDKTRGKPHPLDGEWSDWWKQIPIGPAVASHLISLCIAAEWIDSQCHDMDTAQRENARQAIKAAGPPPNLLMKMLLAFSEKADAETLEAVRDQLAGKQGFQASATLLATTYKEAASQVLSALGDTQNQADQASEAGKEMKVFLDKLKENPTDPEVLGALEKASVAARGKIFNTLLTHAAEQGFAQSMLALLPLSYAFVTEPPEPQSHDAKLHIATPQDLFKKLASFPEKDRIAMILRLL